MRPFAQFYTAQEYEQFLTNLERERELRLRLTELNRYRENGITRHEECAHFEQVMAQTLGQTETTDQWTEKKSVSSRLHCKLNYLLSLGSCSFLIFMIAHASNCLINKVCMLVHLMDNIRYFHCTLFILFIF